jgi:hypothetical protein
VACDGVVGKQERGKEDHDRAFQWELRRVSMTQIQVGVTIRPCQSVWEGACKGAPRPGYYLSVLSIFGSNR